MERIKKLLVRVLALALVCALLAGCGAGTTTTQTAGTEPKNSEAQNTGNEVLDKPTETIVWYVRNGNDITDKDKIEDAINAYIEPLIGVKVSILTTKEEPELALALAAGEDIDLFWTASWANGNNYINENSCVDLTDYLEQYSDLKNSIPENVWTAAQYKGRNYFVPVYKEAATGMCVAYSKNMADKYGWDLSKIKTYEELTPYLEQLKEDGCKCPFGISIDLFTTSIINDIEVKAFNGTIGIRRDDPTKIVNLAESEEYKAYVNLMHEWNKLGYIPAEKVDFNYMNDVNDCHDAFESGDLGFIWWQNVPDGEANASARYKTPIEFTMISDNYLSYNGTFGSAYMINSKSEKVDSCLKFLSLLCTDQVVADYIVWGIEGTHYTRDADGYVSPIADSGYKSGGTWATCSVMAPSLQVGEAADKKAQYAEFNENALVSPLASFTFDQSPVDAEYAAVNAVFEEYRWLLDAGFYDPAEYLPKYQQALKEAGIDTIIAEMQAQYDAYLANN